MKFAVFRCNLREQTSRLEGIVAGVAVFAEVRDPLWMSWATRKQAILRLWPTF